MIGKIIIIIIWNVHLWTKFGSRGYVDVNSVFLFIKNKIEINFTASIGLPPPCAQKKIYNSKLQILRRTFFERPSIPFLYFSNISYHIVSYRIALPKPCNIFLYPFVTIIWVQQQPKENPAFSKTYTFLLQYPF